MMWIKKGNVNQWHIRDSLAGDRYAVLQFRCVQDRIFEVGYPSSNNLCSLPVSIYSTACQGRSRTLEYIRHTLSITLEDSKGK